jgi:hypothetical protein
MFNIVLEEMIRNIETSSNGTIFNRTRQCVACTVDVLVLERPVRVSEEVATEVKEAAVRTGLVIKESEEKYMKININTIKGKI